MIAVHAWEAGADALEARVPCGAAQHAEGAALLDVMGINYHIQNYDSFHNAHKTQPLIGSETSSDVSDRGVYANDVKRAYVSAYDVNKPGWGNTAEDAWCAIERRDFVAGAGRESPRAGVEPGAQEHHLPLARAVPAVSEPPPAVALDGL